MSCLGPLRLQRRWWGSRCGCEVLGYGADAVLGLTGAYTRTLQQHLSRLAADVSFAKAREHLTTLLRVKLSKESLRRECHRQGQRMVQWQTTEMHTPQAFTAAAGDVEFTTDAGKVNTLDEGWKDLKIGVFQKRKRATPATPAQWQQRTLRRRQHGWPGRRLLRRRYFDGRGVLGVGVLAYRKPVPYTRWEMGRRGFGAPCSVSSPAASRHLISSMVAGISAKRGSVSTARTARRPRPFWNRAANYYWNPAGPASVNSWPKNTPRGTRQNAARL